MSEPDLETLFRARPELRLALPYLGAGNGPAQLALAGIVRQWLEAVYSISEPTVARSKLNWWGEELTAAQQGHTHHPLAAALFADGVAEHIEPDLWHAAIDAGLALRQQPPASDFAAQLAACEAFHGAVAKLETTLCFGPEGEPGRAARLAALGHLLSSLQHLGHARADNDGLPMQLLARHGLERSGLGRDSDARRAAIADQLADLQKAFADAMYMAGPLSLPAELTALADIRQVRKAARAKPPLAALADSRVRVSAPIAWAAWRAGRRHRRRQSGNASQHRQTETT